jgi:hypothetical protein
MIPTSYLLLENIIANCSDKDLEQAINCLRILKEKKRMTYNGLSRIPFVKDVFAMINDEFDYRNQEIEEDNLAVH